VKFVDTGTQLITYPQPVQAFRDGKQRTGKFDLRSLPGGSHLPWHVLETRSSKAVLLVRGRLINRMGGTYIPHSDRPVESLDHKRKGDKNQGREK
jgi:hypothetical protein